MSFNEEAMNLLLKYTNEDRDESVFRDKIKALIEADKELKTTLKLSENSSSSSKYIKYLRTRAEVSALNVLEYLISCSY